MNSSDVKVRELRVRAVKVPMAQPHRTASGTITESPLVLTDAVTDDGAIGHSLVFTYTEAALKLTATTKLGALTPNQIVDMQHPLVRLGQSIDWLSFEAMLGATYHSTHGAPGISTRLMVALHYLKYPHDLSDENVVAHWVENPYWQHFSGERYFRRRLPIDASSMTRWRGRLGEAGAEQMLRETIATGIRMGAIRAAQLKRINVDTTVQTKAIRYPTDARLYHRSRERLVKAARREGVTIKQSYRHVGKRLLMASSRYAHARQMKRARACTRKLHTQLGLVVREIERQVTEPSEKLAG